MSFKGLQSRLDKLPLILAGPILRRTEANSVTVWLALKSNATVRLKVQRASDGMAMFDGLASPVQLGDNLFVVVVTAKPTTTTKELKPGNLYQYQLEFQSTKTLTLGDATVFSSGGGVLGFAYAGFQLPTFTLPPADIKAVRVFHGSCRKAHGEGYDALAILDDLLAKDAASAVTRPHLLLLTGDQIYADDVGDALLKMIMDAASVLIKTKETLPQSTVVPWEASSQTVSNLGDFCPGTRALPSIAFGFTSAIPIREKAKSHLFAFAEYVCMHLFVWSDVLWPDDFPTYAEARGAAPGTDSDGEKRANAFADELKLLRAFWHDLSRVRRALANVPTYMMCDDHEITDDWNVHYKWVHDVLDGEAPPNAGAIPNMGRQVVMNGMAAYAVCQATGNTPASFEVSPGKDLLKACAAWSRSATPANLVALQSSLLPAAHQSTDESRALRQPVQPVKWGYSLQFPAFEVVVLDSRTQRSFTRGDQEPAEVISSSALKAQVAAVSGQADYLLVVAPSPVIGNTVVEMIQATKAGISPEEFLDVDMETWSASAATFERLFAQLAIHAPLQTGISQRRQRIALLSGDVHYGFVRRMRYSAQTPFEDTASSVELVVVQATSSSLRNQTDKRSAGLSSTISMQDGITRPFVSGAEGVASRVNGYTNASGGKLDVGIEAGFAYGLVTLTKVSRWGSPVVVERELTGVYTEPEWKYRIDNIVDARPVKDRILDLPPAPSPTGVAPLEAILTGNETYHTSSAVQHGKSITGYNNIGELRLGPDEICQTLYWFVPGRGSDEHIGLSAVLPLVATTRLSASASFDNLGW